MNASSRDMQDGVIVASQDGRALQANPQAAVLLGLCEAGPAMIEGRRLTGIDAAFDEVLLRCDADEGKLLRIGPGRPAALCAVCGEPGSARPATR